MSAPNGGDMRELAADLGAVERIVAADVIAVVQRGAQNVKAAMRRDLSASEYFGRAQYDVNYDLVTDDREVDGVYADIGPQVGRGSGHAGGLAWIGYFGSPSGGGGTVRDPIEALEDEAPAFERHLSDVVNAAIDRSI